MLPSNHRHHHHHHHQGVRQLNRVAKILRARRLAAGALTLASPEVRIMAVRSVLVQRPGPERPPDLIPALADLYRHYLPHDFGGGRN